MDVDQEFSGDEGGMDFAVILGAVKQHKIWAVIITLVVFAVGVPIIFLLPTSYRSTATILLEEPEVPRNLVQTTVTVFAAEQIQYINQRVMTRSNLAQIIEKFDLYAEKRRYMPTLLLTGEVQSNMLLNLINVDVAGGGRQMVKAIAFTLGFEDEKPEIAQQVANELVSLYMEENVRSRTVQTAETSEFLGGEVDRLDQAVRELEEEVAQFKRDNADALPEMVAFTKSMGRRTEDELLGIERRLDTIDDTNILLDAQLAQIEPTKPRVLPGGATVASSQDQLKGLQTRLAMLEGLYNEDHPDVMRTRREINALQAETGLTADLTETTALLEHSRTELAKARENYEPDHPEIARLERLIDSLIAKIKDAREVSDALIEADNPPYIQLKAQKDGLIAQKRALIEQQRKMREKLTGYEEAIRKGPGVEQELTALARQLQSATTRYFATRDRQFGAEMGEALETQSKGERFVLVEPANFPLKPSRPDRPALLVLLALFAPGMGAGWIALRMFMDKSVWGTNMLGSILGEPPIAEIPLIVTQAERVRARRILIAMLAGVPVMIVAAAVAVHFVIRPLDVLWFIMRRQLGI